MGCYSNEVILETVPSLLPKFCCLVSVTTPKEKPFVELNIRSYIGDQLLAEQIINAEQFEQSAEFFKKSTSDTSMIIVKVQMAFVPLLINEVCTLRIEITTEDGLMLGPKLRFTTKLTETLNL